MHKLKIAGKLTLLLMLFLVANAIGQEAPLEPGNSRGLFVVEDALSQFQALKHHGEALAWILPEATGAPDPSLLDHYQGLARYPGTGTPIFYVSQKDNDDPTVPDATGAGGYLHIFRFGTRPTDGERLRSNLQVAGSDTKHTAPSHDDIWQRAIRFDGTLQIDGELLPAYVHPGGMVIVDDILLLAIDSPPAGDAPTGQIVLFDLSADPEYPIAIHAFPLSHAIDNLAVTQQQDGTYLIWANGDGGKAIRIYQTTSNNLRHELIDLELIQEWDHNSSADYDGAGNPWPGTLTVWGDSSAHQSSTFVREPDGTLYMIGMWHEGAGDTGWDYADLYRVDPKSEGGFKLTRLSTRNFHCEYRMSGGALETDGRICNFAAADSAYVSPSGELMLYSMTHDDEDSNDPDFVRLGEFRHRDVNREGSPLRRPVAEANGPYTVVEGQALTLSGSGWPQGDRPWVELYDDIYWQDRSIVVDYDDRALLELNDFDDLDGFGDKTSSIRWRMPAGLDAELFDDHDFSDRRIVLKGTGQTEMIANLNAQTVIPGVVEHPGRDAGAYLSFNDKTSSMRFVGTPDNTSLDLTWDLDHDGIFGETGAEALHGDEVGATVTFGPTRLDGPSHFGVRLRVTNGSVLGEGVAAINIVNAPPTATMANLSGDLIQGEAALLHFSNQQDPSRADEEAGFTYAYDCTADGTFEIVDSALAEVACGYPEAGTFTARGLIADKDGGTTSYDVPITVLSPAEALARLLDLVESMNFQQGIDNSLDAKLDAAAGALAELDNNNNAAASNTLQAFINSVEAQRDSKITAEQADSLIALAQRIIDSLSAE